MRTSERKKQTERRLGIGRVSEALALLQGNARVQPSKQPNSDANGHSPRFPHVILRHAPDEAFPVTEPWNCDRLLSRLSSLRTLIIFFFLLPLSSPPSLLPGLYIPWSSWRVALDPCSTTPPLKEFGAHLRNADAHPVTVTFSSISKYSVPAGLRGGYEKYIFRRPGPGSPGLMGREEDVALRRHSVDRRRIRRPALALLPPPQVRAPHELQYYGRQ